MADYSGGGLVLLEFTIPLEPRTKKNSGRIAAARGGAPILLPSKAYAEYEEAAGWHVKGRGMLISEPVNVMALYCMATRRTVDLSNLCSALSDVLVKYGVVADDCRDIIASYDGSRVMHDKQRPRTEVTITRVAGYAQWRGWGAGAGPEKPGRAKRQGWG
jgi:Holliday junction resolvase RusA-like endonuclease